MNNRKCILNIYSGYIYKNNRPSRKIHFFPTIPNATFVSSCEFNGLVSKSCRILPAALFYYPPQIPRGFPFLNALRFVMRAIAVLVILRKNFLIV